MVVAAGGLELPRLLRRPAGAQIDQLYRRYADEVFRYSLTVLRSRADAEDVVQTVFMRALRAVERGERVAKPRNWLIKIAHNECRRLLTTRKVHAELPDELAVEPVERGRADELRGALEALPVQQKQALVLRELEGRTYADIATRLHVSVSAVETLLFRARRALREQLDAAIGCDEFALLLDDPDADRARLRAHARACESCAHLERQARGRKSRLGRIASTLFPWWGTGAKVAAVALGTATFAGGIGGGIAIADGPHHHHQVAIPAAGPAAASLPPATTALPTSTPRRAVSVSDTRKVSDTAAVPAAPVLRLPTHHADPGAPQPTSTAPAAAPPMPGPAPAPAATPAPAAPAPAPAPAATPVPVPNVTTAPVAVTTTVTTPAVTVSTPVATATVPSVTVPSVTAPTVTATTPTVTVQPITTPILTTPAVTVPSVTISTPTLPLPLPQVSGP
jgi:RNA polymerase sigma factor (sigma-70 family)